MSTLESSLDFAAPAAAPRSGQLLPYEFARNSGLLRDPASAELLLCEGCDIALVGEALRSYPNDTLTRLAAEPFAERLKAVYAAVHGSSEAVMADIKAFVDMESAAAELEQAADLLDGEEDAPIIRLLNAILAESLKEGASDIHIEPYEQQALVRFRLDGVLRTVLSPSVQIAPLLISRIKVMAKLDIAERRLPQDGRMSVRLAGRNIDLRVSTLPASHGERVVMRLLDKQAGQLQLDDLGMPAAIKQQLDELIARPHGIVLVTGPTGSGKTTTLYAGLQRMDRQGRNIMTVEDPVEYDLPGISQTQINLKAGMTFARGLRAILRQDPDVVLIGEIRDGETAEIATQSSLTGHLVLSTLHTNTAAGAIGRLQDLGVDGFLLASTVRGVISQRLVRRLCGHCRQLQPASEAAAALVGQLLTQLYQPHGCAQCNHTGFQGRQALFELVTVDPQLQALIHDGASELEIEKQIRTSVPSLRSAGMQLVAEGVTTLEEVLRVTSG